MTARINHLTIVSENNYALSHYYQGFFHMRPAGAQGPTDDVTIGDGRIGLNIRPRVSGHPAQLDHFGIEVDDLGRVQARIRESFPGIDWIERGQGVISTHDPMGNVVLVAHTGAAGRDGFYEVQPKIQDRVVDHFALRVRRPQLVADFYTKVFELAPLANPPAGDNLYFTDGHVTLVIIPWRLGDFEDTGISARGMDHIGFKVESIDTLKADIARVTARNPRFQPSETVVGRGKEGGGRLEMFRRTCPLGCHHMADADGLLLDVRE
ncbi:MAG TPA: VOC family protein [Alphaproteobacteria bacterium]|jgi:catechol 2,3-dioxygenase-like lactoylglutathione lyase family enzyme|nr:VOC family protein [Alphaproteobacteria bacterium]